MAGNTCLAERIPMIRVAPVLIPESAALSLEVLLPNEQAARVLGISSAAAAAEVIRHLLGAVRC
ncbi:MAG: hypothetical protein EOP06_04805 [Proteobacteria bacterium]|nr:MAG: hypothetical protein EOP06_04805 [Pseudomonadota bacterium]